MNRIGNHTMALIIALPALAASAHAENLRCDAMFLDPVSNTPVPGAITALTLTEQSITLTGKDNQNTVYQIDVGASKIAERTYVAKIGTQPIGQTPTDKQISVMMVKPEDTDKKFDGLLTDSKLDNYVLLNCKAPTVKPPLL